ncbi:MAG: hypothetical protein ABIG46_00260 [Candidatus Omnitrophota bacterium]|nr:hypothetical protein [Candidatus Omnitrophota bacterium]
MKQESKETLIAKIKKFFAQLFENIDKKMEAEAKSKPCCCKPAEGKDKSCCN